MFSEFYNSDIFVLLQRNMMIMMDKKIPDYYLSKNNITFFLIFLFLFSLIFVNVFTPFQGAWYNISSYTRLQLFSDTLIIVTGGLLVLLISRVIMKQFHKRHPLTFLRYWIWQIVEVILIAFLYTFINRYIVGDNRDFSEIFVRSIIYVPLIMVIPVVISILYFGIKDREEQLSALNDFVSDDLVLDNHITQPKRETTNNNTEPTYNSTDIQELINESTTKNKIINFFDEKDELQISLKNENIYYLETSENYIHIYYKNKDSVERYTLRSSMKKQSEKLEKYGFIRCHRSYLVNFQNIVMMRKDKDGPYLDFGVVGIAPIPVSKTYLESVTQYFIQNSED